MSIHADLRHVIYALSDALDLVGVDDVAHGKRVGIMAAECAQAMGLSRTDTTFLFDLGMLHDIGVSSTHTHQKLVGEFDWAGSQLHAELGCALLKDFAPLAAMAEPIHYHHTHWEALRQLPLDPAVARQANLIFMVDRVDALAAPHYSDGSLLEHMADIRAQIQARRDNYFAPELVDVFLDISRSEAFWLLLEPSSIQGYLQDQLAFDRRYEMSMAELKQLAEIFSRIVDAKSPFTAQHSLGVSRLAKFLAGKLGISPDNCEKIEIAGLLHDLGKLRVPDEILDKPGALDTRERLMIHTHSFETFRILHNIKGFEEIAPWAAYHHEEPGGGGYPFRLKSESLPLEARILRIADIFQAMVQNRPYRQGLNAEDTLAFLGKVAGEDPVDQKIVAVVAASIDDAMATARPQYADLPQV
ncbi:HD domain-containing protein [Denitratisoma sp. agr-D3]